MKKIHVLTTNTTHNSLALNLPLRLHRNELKEMGIYVALFFEQRPEVFECDVLFINSKYYRSGYSDDDVIDQIDSAHQSAQAVLWFDTTDSTGATQFQYLPYVDGYYKNQVLRDRRHYLNDYYGSRIFTDFFHIEFEICDTDTSFQTVLPTEEYLHKIQVSWNSALGDYGPQAALFDRVRKILPARRLVRFTTPERVRTIPISCRIGRTHKRETIRFHRNQVSDILEKHFSVETGRISPRAYHRELQNARLGLSPFGWGEFAYRDYEVIINGAVLVKPDMSHLETWPNLYVDGETYIPHRWDCTDLTEKLHEALSSSQTKDIAVTAQTLYRHHLITPEGHQAFCNRIAEIVKRHTE